MLVLVRHGESTGNAAGLLLGRGEWPLTEAGRVQASAVAEQLAGPPSDEATSGERVRQVVSSPIGRARQTAEVLADRCRAGPVVVDPRWAELDYGDLDGTPVADVPADVWRRWRRDVTFAPPAGESMADLGRRVRDACRDLAGPDGPMADPRRHVVVVSHVSPIKAAVAWALATDDAVAWRLHLAPGAVSVIGWAAGAPVLRGYNLQPGRPLLG